MLYLHCDTLPVEFIPLVAKEIAHYTLLEIKPFIKKAERFSDSSDLMQMIGLNKGLYLQVLQDTIKRRLEKRLKRALV